MGGHLAGPRSKNNSCARDAATPPTASSSPATPGVTGKTNLVRIHRIGDPVH
ncbi:hypothetical protein [Streptomyces sp. NPDC088762]|uniref:hypothetical protein n=1 Tax=Streptomyces sp. NPDC088762 TaxID=3365891 RepID=UPI003804F3E6